MVVRGARSSKVNFMGLLLTLSVSSEHSNNRKDPNILKLNSTLSSYLWTKKEGSKEITKYFELKWNKSITYQKLLVNLKGNQLWIFIRRMMLKLKLQYFGHLTWRADSLEKTLILGKTGQEKKGTTEDEMVGWHHWFNGQEFEQTLGDSEGQGSLECCSPWGCKESDMTEWTRE